VTARWDEVHCRDSVDDSPDVGHSQVERIGSAEDYDQGEVWIYHHVGLKIWSQLHSSQSRKARISHVEEWNFNMTCKCERAGGIVRNTNTPEQADKLTRTNTFHVLEVCQKYTDGAIVRI
jgi:hypothetical protein